MCVMIPRLSFGQDHIVDIESQHKATMIHCLIAVGLWTGSDSTFGLYCQVIVLALAA